MYQDASTNSLLTNTSTEDTASTSRDNHRKPKSEQFSTVYAERLMDDLFQEVENLLEMKPSASTRMNEEEFSPVESESAEDETYPSSPELSSQPAVAEPPSIPAEYPSKVAPLQTMAPDRMEPAIAQPSQENRIVKPLPLAAIAQEPKRTYDRLMLGVGCVSVVVSLALWLLYQEGKRQQVAVSPATPQAATNATDSTGGNRQFADYLQKALRNIEQKSSTASAPTASASTTATQLPSTNTTQPGMPTVTIPKTNGVPSITPGRVSTGLERIYVPVYQIPPNLYPPGTPIAPLPNLPKNKTAPARPAPTVAASSRPAPVPSAPAVTRKLVGVFDQGDRSAALIETNGVTQRYEIGESVGSSGWTLVDVTKDQAIIRRNGEVRSLFVGHVF